MGPPSERDEAKRLALEGVPGYPDGRSYYVLCDMFKINLVVFNTLVDPPTMTICGNMGVDGNDSASLVIRQHKVADGDKHLSDHYDVILHGEQKIQRPCGKSPTMQVAQDNLDGSQELPPATGEEILVIEKLLVSREKNDDEPLAETEYLVKWLGYDNPTDNSWEPRCNLGIN